MTPANIAGYRNIDSFVEAKLSKLDASAGDLAAISGLMFSEKENVLWEESRGYRTLKVTYGEAEAASVRAAGNLASHPALADAPRDTVVALAAGNSAEWIELLWAILRAGFRPLLVNTRLPGQVTAKTLADMSCAAVVTDGTSLPDEEALPLPCPRIGFPELFSEGGSAVPGRAFGSEIIVMLSGTSANVKCCAFGAEAIAGQIRCSAGIIRSCPAVKRHFEGELKLLALLPFYHIFGLSALYIWFAFFSRTFVRLGDLSPRTVLNTIRKHRVTHIFAVPLFWEKTREAAVEEIKKRGERTWKKFSKGLSLSLKLDALPPVGRLFRKAAMRQVRDGLFGESISFMITGGGCVSRETLEFFNGIGYRLVNGYGMTETGITSVELGDSLRIICSGSVGMPLDGIDYSLEDGILAVEGRISDCTFREGVRVPSEGRFVTGDLASRDGKTGRWYIRGRSDELVVGATGENLNPNIVEPLFDGCGARGVCLCGVGDVPVPTLVVSCDPYITEENLASLKERITAAAAAAGLTGLIGGYYFTSSPLIGKDDFKLNRRLIAGRVASGELRKIVCGGERLDGAADPELLSRIRAAFAAALGKDPGDISDDADFFADCGGSSFDWFAMTSGLSEALGIGFPQSADGLSSIKDIYNYSEDRKKD